MTVTVHEEFVPRVKVRRRRSVLRLRQPEAAYGPAALGLLYATGLMGMLFAMTGLAGADATTAGALSAPALSATAITAILIGGRVRRYKERNQLSMVLRIACIWGAVGATWPLLQIIPAIAYGDVRTFAQLMETVGSMALDALAGGVAGTVGGLAGAGAAIGLCIERVR